MPYKDLDKRRECIRLSMQKIRAKRGSPVRGSHNMGSQVTQPKKAAEVQTQSYNPMMVGYVPPNK